MEFNTNKIISFFMILLGSTITSVGFMNLGIDFITWVQPAGWHIRTFILGIAIISLGYFLNKKGII